MTPLRSPHPRSRSLARVATASAVLVLSLGLTACGDDDSDSDGDDPSPRTSATTSASDSGSDSGSDSPSATDSPDAPSSSAVGGNVPSETDLRGALLTADDLPDGFTEASDDTDDGSTSFDGTCLEDVGDLSDAIGTDSVEDAEVEFDAQTPTGQASVQSKIDAYADADAVARGFASFSDTLQQCTSVQATEDGVTYDLAISYDDTVDLPGADDQLTVDITGTLASGEQSYPATFRFVAGLEGSLVSVVGAFSIGDDATGVVDQTADLASTQAERVSQLA